MFDTDGRWVEFVKRAASDDRIRLVSEYIDHQSTPEVKRYDGSGFVTRMVYDRLYRLTDVYRPGFTSGQAHRTSLTYDAGSRVGLAQDGNGSVIATSYDIAGRVLLRTVAPGSGVSYMATQEVVGYDSIGRLASIETRAGASQQTSIVEVGFTNDSLGRLLQESFELFGVVNGPLDVDSGYAVSGNPVGDPSFRRSLSYPAGFAVEFVPDAVGRLEEVQLLPPQQSQFQLAQYRRAGGQQIFRQTAIGSGAEMKTTFGFDDYRRLDLLQHQVGSNTPFQKFELTWDAGGDLIRKKHDKVDGSAGDLYAHDAYHRLVGAKQGVSASDISGSYSAASSAAKETAYALDAGQSRDSVTVTLANQSPVVTNYTNQSNSPRYSAVGAVTPLYDGEGNLVFDGARYYVYDFRNRLSEVWVVSPDDEGNRAQSSSSTSSRTEVGRFRTRITREDLQGGRASVLSRIGTDIAAYCRQNEIQAGDPSLRIGALQTTGGGSTQQSSQSGGQGEEQEDFSLTLVAYYGYDPFNRRVVRNAGGLDLRYVYDGWREIEEWAVDGDDLTARLATMRGEGLDEILALYRNESGTWVGRTAFQDHLGSVVELRDGLGNRAERVEYDPYGRASVFVGSSTTAQGNSSVGNPWLFTGAGRLDEETGLLYMRNRYLHTEWGRFATIDPIGGWADGANLGNAYGYVGNAASMWSDPLGLSTGHLFGGGDDIYNDLGNVSPFGSPEADPNLIYNQDPAKGGDEARLCQLRAAVAGLRRSYDRQVELIQQLGGAWHDLPDDVRSDEEAAALYESAIDAMVDEVISTAQAHNLAVLALSMELTDLSQKLQREIESNQHQADVAFGIANAIGLVMSVVGVGEVALAIAAGVRGVTVMTAGCVTRTCIGYGSARGVAPALRALTEKNFRHNLGQLTGGIPRGAQAHHVFPQKFGEHFARSGLNVHDPKFGAWWDALGHQRAASGYNQAWERFLQTAPSREQIIQFGRDIMGQYGIPVIF